jgi:Family of unknown function (DUF5367)
MKPRLIVVGFVIWLLATVALRLAGQRLLRPGEPSATLILFAVTFPLMALLVRRVCISARLPREEWLSAAVSLLLPTLLLDPFSSAFFSIVFPNMVPEVAGVFGGWMLWCCAGGLIGAMLWRPKSRMVETP